MSAPEPRNRTPRTALQKWIWWLSLAYLLALVLLHLVQRFAAERTWWTLLLTYVSQRPFAYPLVLLLLASVFSRNWRALAVNVLTAVFFLYALAGLARPHLRHAPPPGPRLRVMTLNAGYYKRLRPEDFSTLAAVHHLDVICLQESSLLRYGTASSDLLRAMPGWQLVVQGELAVLTRYPMRGWQYRPYARGTRAALAARLTVDERPVTVITTHFSTTYPPDARRGQWRRLAEYVAYRAQLRASQEKELLTFVSQQQGPVLVAGDLNTPPRGLLYRDLTRSLQDAFVATGRGFGYTFPSTRPRYRIDYLLTRPGLTTVSCEALPLGISDHRAVVGEFVVTGKKAAR